VTLASPQPEKAPAVPNAAALRRPRAILFDWDNTLVDSWGTIHEALNHVMAAMEKPLWSLDDTMSQVRLSLREAFPLHFGERWEEARDIYLNRFAAIHLDRLTPLRGREAMLRSLAGEGFYLGIVSNKTGPFLRREVDRLGRTPLFGSVVGAGDAAVDKPACEPVHLALKESGVTAGSEVWFVGDTAVDMECAANAGCVPVLLGDGADTEEFARFAPALAFSDEESLREMLRRL